MNNQQKLLSMAQTAASNAYCPYSHFAVGAAIESEDGKFYAGCNVENVSYPVGTCAETGAISAMIAGGSKRISAILIYADSKTLISPCGACRQRRLLHLSDAERQLPAQTGNALYERSQSPPRRADHRPKRRFHDRKACG